ncbi:MAG: tRNA preQ1(34) S-adenosylmethionine ribosyltransferase-isomerase QueA [Alphaproteobacteria bacterium]|nr:tRNA preQ1(34) S-adenosylmethionine ribosyltransferase-isomerase QueA [Alphaproteobacteria bacterium]
MTNLHRSDFFFELPSALIAQEPARPREAARLLQVQGAALQDWYIRDLPKLLRPGDLLVANDTRVIPARLFGQRGTVRFEVLLHQALGGGVWRVFARPGKRLRPDDTIVFAPDFAATVRAKQPDGQLELDFHCSDADLFAQLTIHGVMPLPPYIKRETQGRASDKQDYQTIFAAQDGAVAAPTAGLHYTPELLTALAAVGVKQTTVTLHVGAGTFLPVKADNLRDHIMHQEWGEVSAATASTINATRAAGGRIVAVGTTSLRLLESAHGTDGQTQPFAATTDIFLYPGKTIRSADVLFTNFHLPESTLFMLVCAFAGMANMQAAYAHAIAEKYRFYSYGDACLLARQRANG